MHARRASTRATWRLHAGCNVKLLPALHCNVYTTHSFIPSHAHSHKYIIYMMKYMYGWLQVARGDVAPAEAHAAIDREAAEAGPAEASGDTSLSDYKGGGVAEAQCLVSSSLHLPNPQPPHTPFTRYRVFTLVLTRTMCTMTCTPTLRTPLAVLRRLTGIPFSKVQIGIVEHAT